MADSEESGAHTHKVSEREKRKNLRPMKHRFHSRKHSSQTQDRLYSNEQFALSISLSSAKIEVRPPSFLICSSSKQKEKCQDKEKILRESK